MSLSFLVQHIQRVFVLMESLFFVEETTRFRFLPAVALHIEYVVAAHCCLKGVVILTFYVDASALTKDLY